MGRHKKKSKNTPAPKLASGGAKQSSVISPKVHPALEDCYPLNKLCRLCLLSNTNMEPIFSYTGDIGLSQRIFQCTSLEIHENEGKGLPTSICGQCKHQLDQSYEFRTLCCKNNEVLQNLNLILSPKKAKPSAPSMMSAVPIVQIEKLPIGPNLLPPGKKVAKRDKSSKSYGEIPLSQLYTPSKRGHKAAKGLNRFTRELVICLTPMSAALVNKYKKKDPKTKTKAAVKAYAPPQAGKSPRVQKQLVKSPRKLTPVAKQKTPKPVKAAAALIVTKKAKAKPVEIAVPPKKRKQNFQPVPEPKVLTVSCTLCAQTFNNLKNLSRHTAAHENNRKQNRVFNCDICQKEYLKPAQLTDHLRSVEHVQNAASHAPDEADVSILPDEQSILPDTNGQQDNISTTVASPMAEQEEEREHSIDREAARSQPSPEPEMEANGIDEEPAADETIHSERAVYNLSPISVESGSPRSADVQCDSTNNEENLLGDDSFTSARRVSFAEVTEILD